MSQPSSTLKQGVLFGLLCYLLWGTFPIYWYPINQAHIGADQILAQRIVWSMLFAMLLIPFSPQRHAFFNALRRPEILAVFALSALMISINWLVYLWAIMNGHILDASLGYFLLPLLNVLIGRVWFKDKINKLQAIAVVIAVVGVLWLAIPVGHIPWVALLLAGSFALYGVIRKLAPMPALAGLALETLLLVPFALGYLWLCHANGTLIWHDLTLTQNILLVGSGAVTAIPLLLFAASVKRAPLSIVGIIQYLSPTLQFFIGLWLFGETLDFGRFVGYAIVWIAVALFVWGILKQQKKPAKN